MRNTRFDSLRQCAHAAVINEQRGARQHQAERQVAEDLDVRRKIRGNLLRVVRYQHGAQAQFPRGLDRLFEEALHGGACRTRRENDRRRACIEKFLGLRQGRRFAIGIPKRKSNGMGIGRPIRLCCGKPLRKEGNDQLR